MSVTRRLLVGLVVAALLLSWTGCAGEGPTPGRLVTGRRVVHEREQQFVLLEEELEDRFSFENPVQRRTANERLEVMVDVRNRTDYAQSVEFSTIFRDAQQVPLDDETAWRPIHFGPNQTQTYRAVSIGPEAAGFTVRVRAME